MKRNWIQRSGFIRRKARRRRSLRARLSAIGKKGREWNTVKRQLSAEFAARGITSCELGYESCWGELALGWAHGRKRRNLKGDELSTLVILACNPCHAIIERMLEDEMCAIVKSVIVNREQAA